MLRRHGSNVLLLLAGLGAGGCAYQADSFRSTRESFDGVRVTVSCLDVAIARPQSDVATSNVVKYSFGNRCDDPVVVDLAAARVYGRAGDGTESTLYAYDPFHEIRMMRLDARAIGHETIDYPSGGMLERMCIDAASISHASVPQWVCFSDGD
jgi:hypothetical protein